MKMKMTKILITISVLILVVPPWFLENCSIVQQMTPIVLGTLLLLYSTLIRMNSKAEKEYWNGK